MTELERTIAAYASFLDERSLARSSDHSINGDPPEIEGEVIMVDVRTSETETPAPGGPGRRTWIQAAIFAAAAAIVVIVAIAVFGGTDEPSGTDLATTSFGVEEALATVDRYFEAHNAGDIDATFAMFTADATFADRYSGDDEFEPEDRAVWEPRFAWDIAQGETLLEPECDVGAEVPGVSVTISCAYGTLDAVRLEMDLPTIPSVVTFTVGPDGISQLLEEYGFPNFSESGFPFAAWMEQNHPDEAEATGCCEGATVEESIARGELRAQYAELYAADRRGEG